MLKKPARSHLARHRSNSFLGLIHLSGFTLIELLVSIAILASLTAGVFVSINPKTQIDKARDAIRQQNIAEIKKGLDVYYSDKGCYPKSTGTEFATALSDGGQWGDLGTSTIYIKKVPKDPDGTPYTYLTDSVGCPQWNILFAKLTKASNIAQTCSLPTNNSCIPQGFDSSWACVTSGTTSSNCSTILAFVLATPTPTTAQPGPTNTPTPTFTPTPTPAVGQFYLTMNTDPWFDTGTIYPYPAAPGTQRLTLNARGANPIKSVSVKVTVNGNSSTHDLEFQSGSTWAGSWSITGSISTYVMDFTVTDTANNTQTFKDFLYK